ncbi:hypothetical protein [Wenjunlia tyrosinilytica]|uniref:Restriction endonuclease type IV Mrr domain-containing protein n=1 Tax=Wenjunlia tyrosinilytica TaxID=1544741 RepID=A0A917ZT86_9ACTN|nr:hypothetical protein [Wenjunlia tyrosinilytica]GGO92466.1 hypothetical protein GCM10012280_42710 [Wenjunlia tyrosinilytica]
MAESVPVRCPACRREHAFTPATFPCACGAPLTVPLLRAGIPVQVRHRSWDDSWVILRCGECGRCDQWPQPEFGCACGATVRLPVDTGRTGTDQPSGRSGPRRQTTAAASLPPLRPPFHPVTIRTSADAVTAAVQYLKWLGFAEVRPSEDRARSGIDIRGKGVVAQVDGDIRPTALKEVECLWLNSLNEDCASAFFALAGYSRDARVRADQLSIPLFVLDLTGTPQAVNEAAEVLIRVGAPTVP